MFEDLRKYIEWLESSGKLHKVNKKVSSDCEITEIVTRMIDKIGPTLLFEKVDNNTIPVAANLFGSEEKVCDALGVDDLEDLYSKSENLISLVDKENSSLKEKIDSAFSLLNIAKILPKSVKKAACQDKILNPEEIHYGTGNESLHDTAKILSEYADIIMLRTHAHKNILEFSKNFNCLSLPPATIKVVGYVFSV